MDKIDPRTFIRDDLTGRPEGLHDDWSRETPDGQKEVRPPGPALNARCARPIAGDNSLDFKMLLKPSGGAGNMLGSLTGLSASAQGKGLPFLIEGKTSNPVFRPALGGAVAGSLQDSLLGAVGGNKGKTDAQGQQKQKPDLKDALGGLFNKKKKPQQ